MSRNEAFAPWQCPLCGGALQGENDLKCENRKSTIKFYKNSERFLFILKQYK